MSLLSHTWAICGQGLSGTKVKVETHIGAGLVGVTLVGLPDASLREAKERVRAALTSCHIPPLSRRITVNLSPAGLPKAGSGFDLAIAVSMLSARGILPTTAFEETVFCAELGLDGGLRDVAGMLPLAMGARQAGFTRMVVAPGSVAMAGLVDGLSVIACGHLSDLITIFTGTKDTLDGKWERLHDAFSTNLSRPAVIGHELDNPLQAVRGQEKALHSLGVAAAGGHHVLLHGPPGVGKTMLAYGLQALLPDLTRQDSLTVTALHSLGADKTHVGMIHRPPVESPHHTISRSAMIGGGSDQIHPGAVSLAHRGVLILDEAPEFSPSVLDSLRQPLEQGSVTVHRRSRQVEFPAVFQMVLTANPCPCGNTTECQCTALQRRRYWSRLSGPLLDRIDMQVSVDHPLHLNETSSAANLDELTNRVRQAHERMRHRWKETSWRCNAEVPGKYLRDLNLVNSRFLSTLDRAVERGKLSLRGSDRILRLAWTLADLAGNSAPTTEDFSAALELRSQAGWVLG